MGEGKGREGDRGEKLKYVNGSNKRKMTEMQHRVQINNRDRDREDTCVCVCVCVCVCHTHLKKLSSGCG